MPKLFTLVIALFIAGSVQAQDSLWTLERTVQYALENNLDIRQSVLNERLSKLQLQQSEFSQLPNASISGNYGRSYGRSIDPTSNQFINAGYTFSGLNGNVDVLLFGWFQKRRTIEQNKFLNKAATADVEQLKDDISLNVATGFLRILLAREQINISESQLKFTLKQREQTTSFVKAGRAPELDLAQMQSQVATDSSNYITALVNYNQSLLDMKALMNFEISAPYTALAPKVDNLPLSDIASLNPEEVYAKAQEHFGSVRSRQLRVDAAKKGLLAAKGNLYPQLTLNGQFGTNYSSTLKEVTGASLKGQSPTGDFVTIDGVLHPIMQADYDVTTRTTPFGKQYDNNFRQTIALSINIPLLNGWNARTAVNKAKVDIQSSEIERDRTRIKLKQDVYKAYYEAKAAIQKFVAADRAAEASSRATSYAEKRYELGLMNALELLTTQNNGFKAKSEAISAKYDMIFKLKVIDYYLGKEIKL
jgi:outer membrane protein